MLGKAVEMRGACDPNRGRRFCCVPQKLFNVEDALVPDGVRRAQGPEKRKKKAVDVLLGHRGEDDGIFPAVAARTDAFDFAEKLREALGNQRGFAGGAGGEKRGEGL